MFDNRAIRSGIISVLQKQHQSSSPILLEAIGNTLLLSQNKKDQDAAYTFLQNQDFSRSTKLLHQLEAQVAQTQ